MKNFLTSRWTLIIAAILFICIPVIIFNLWMNKELAVMERDHQSPAMVSKVKSTVNSYGSNVKIDPLNDPLAPAPKVISPRPPQDEAAEEARQYAPPGDILVQ